MRNEGSRQRVGEGSADRAVQRVRGGLSDVRAQQQAASSTVTWHCLGHLSFPSTAWTLLALKCLRLVHTG